MFKNASLEAATQSSWQRGHPSPLSLNTRQTMGAMTEKRVKHKHRITKRFLCVSFSSFQVELLSETLSNAE